MKLKRLFSLAVSAVMAFGVLMTDIPTATATEGTETMLDWTLDTNGNYVLENNTDETIMSVNINALRFDYIDDLGAADYSDIGAFRVDYDFEGDGRAVCNVKFNTYDEKGGDWANQYTLSSTDYDTLLESHPIKYGVLEKSKLIFQVEEIDPGMKLVIKSVDILSMSPRSTYIQYVSNGDGTCNMRMVDMIDETVAKSAKSVDFTAKFSLDGTEIDKTAVLTTTSYYKSVSACGEQITADDGYVFVAYVIKNVPEEYFTGASAYIKVSKTIIL